MCVAVDSQTCILRICFYIDAEFHYPTPLCCIPEGRAGNRTITNPGEHLKMKKNPMIQMDAKMSRLPRAAGDRRVRRGQAPGGAHLPHGQQQPGVRRAAAARGEL